MSRGDIHLSPLPSPTMKPCVPLHTSVCPLPKFIHVCATKGVKLTLFL